MVENYGRWKRLSNYQEQKIKNLMLAQKYPNNVRILIITGLVAVAAFVLVLYYLISESNNKKELFRLTQVYLQTENLAEQIRLESEIKIRLSHRKLALTSRASFGSFEELIVQARACEGYAAQAGFSPRGSQEDLEKIWLYCMDNPEIISK